MEQARNMTEYGCGKEEYVECHYKGNIIKVPERKFFRILTAMKVDDTKFIRYKDAPKIYSMSERAFNKVAHDAGAVYKVGGSALVKTEIIDEYLETFRI